MIMMINETIRFCNNEFKAVRINNDLYAELSLSEVIDNIRSIEKHFEKFDEDKFVKELSECNPACNSGATRYFYLLYLNGVFMHPDDDWADCNLNISHKNVEFLNRYVDAMKETLGDKVYDLGTEIWGILDNLERLQSEADELNDKIIWYTDLVLEDLTETDFLNGLDTEYAFKFRNLYNHRVVRRCSVCGKVMVDGYMDNDVDFHACSEKCLKKSYKSLVDGDKMLKNDLERGSVFYTEWESPFYDI